MTSDEIIDILLGGPDPDPGCDATMSQLAAWADQKQAGLDADAAFPGVAAHLHNCASCREDAEGLLVMLIEQPGPPE